MKEKTVQYCSNNKLCCSCGFCADICPTNAITIKEHNSVYVPTVNMKNCVKCGQCYDICSGKGNDWYKKTELIAEKQEVKCEYMQDIGFYNSCYIAHATDYETRFHCASGGVVTSLLVFMLKSKIIDGAVVTRFTKEDPLSVETIIATTEDEILSAKSSKYCPVHMDGIITQLKDFNGKVAYVGLPCQLQTLHNVEGKIKWLQEKIILRIGLFCSGTKDKRALDYLLKKNEFKKEGITKFAYRDEGCLGNVKAEYGTNCKIVPYLKAYSIMHSYFKPERCVSCLDHFAFFSDISLGDIDCVPYNDDKIGSNSVIIRTDIAKEIFTKALEENVIYAESIVPSEIKRSQKVLFYRKSVFIAYRFLHIIMCKAFPKYDKLPDTKLSLKGILWAISFNLQRLLSKIGIVK